MQSGPGVHCCFPPFLCSKNMLVRWGAGGGPFLVTPHVGWGWMGWGGLVLTRLRQHVTLMSLTSWLCANTSGPFQGIGALLMVHWVGSRIHESRTPKVYARDPAETGFIQFSDRPLLKVSGMHRIFTVVVSNHSFLSPEIRALQPLLGRGRVQQ